ncbi:MULTISPECIES: ABC transporter ATP-binding protein [Sinorhizobium/Ensifer group]|uniref:ABC transporter ATP-binding protein n=1 Tax=Sinorhizobium/Ensifer group TaxID=227292 RepID=UPI00071DCD33|nr:MULTISPECIES: sn-glycerol-3-phosphate ABC transporter ATP-binding protein UgpC [Sinorhizobium/Ensifer group]KSV84874.1 sugar ABC transporter ATP-binding protein [Sinorhizobium sp. Sb3]KSV96009.1 sugar ABC transporter ATP-binding protein [Sinorhizobium sp. GL28]MBV7516397.1 sn-glycerol-3-phosphate ABC transporter ATP-binding protein UgpC [Ensifer sp. ENS12]SDA40698.1 alpha-glucoside transport system ATP-binding protein [Sinorhizobium sp. NFACC03]
MTGLLLKDIRKSYGAVDVIHGINLDIKQGEFIVFVGPSGCGKSTLLRMIAGLEEITGGDMFIDGERVNTVPPSKRGIAMVFQSYALYPHMTVYDNMAFGMRIAKESKEEIDRRVRAAADILQLTKYLDRLPKALSGGQRQRVAIGRAICRDPKVFLFDEPLSNLDAALRVATRIEIAKLNEQMADTTMIYVTHDQVEAMTLADRIVVLSQGHIEQVGAPLELYERPANLFVARFIGSPAMNIIPSAITATGAQTTVKLTGGKSVTLDIATDASQNGKMASFGVRPEDLQVSTGEDFLFEGTVAIVEALGEVTLLYIEGLVDKEPIIAKIPGILPVHRGDKVRFTADKAKLHLFDADGRSYRA